MQSILVTLLHSDITGRRIRISDDDRHFFPENDIPFTIMDGIKSYPVHVHERHQKYDKEHFHFSEWFNIYPNLEADTQLRIAETISKEKYRLEIVK